MAEGRRRTTAGITLGAVAAGALGPVQACAGWAVATAITGRPVLDPVLWLLGLTAVRAALQAWSVGLVADGCGRLLAWRSARWAPALLTGPALADQRDLMALHEGDQAAARAWEIAATGLGAALVAAWAHPGLGAIAIVTVLVASALAYAGLPSLSLLALRSRRQEHGWERRLAADAMAAASIRTLGVGRICAAAIRTFDRDRDGAERRLADGCRQRILLVQVAGVCGQLALVALGAALVRQGDLGIGPFIAAIVATTTAVVRLEGLAVVILRRALARIAARRLARIPQPEDVPAGEGPLAAALTLPGGELLAIAPGEAVAVVGHGLERLAAICAGGYAGGLMLASPGGRILTAAETASRVAVVGWQDAVFSGSVVDQVAAAGSAVLPLRLAAAEHLAGRDLGHAGEGLSGGERARVALARALAAAPGLLCWCDAGRSLDAVSAGRVLGGVFGPRGQPRPWTILALGMAAAASCDRVVWLREDGSLRCGGHEQLLQDEPGYRALMPEAPCPA